MPRHWTEIEDAAIARLIAAGVTNAEIAEALGRSETAVAQHIWKLRQAGALPPGRTGVRQRAVSEPEPAPDLEPIAADVRSCELCGAPWATHLRCRGCTIGIGPEHQFTKAFDGYCRWCWDERQRTRYGPEGPRPVARHETRSGSVLTLTYDYEDGTTTTNVRHFPAPVPPFDPDSDLEF